MSTTIDTANRFLVCVAGGELALLAPPKRGQKLTVDDIACLCGWLLVLCPEADDKIDSWKKAIRNT